ncbi:MAG: glycosyltransferase [Deltaproteobacteria bacterium]|nr:glycosyltransferase [Deltaproteobacteria bacterium]
MSSRDRSGEDASGARPEVSIIIPVYNEESILETAVGELCQGLVDCGFTYEVWLAENGSVDGTVAIARAVSERWPQVQTFSVSEPNYGRALRLGIARARGAIVICEEIDLCDTDFQRRAHQMLSGGTIDMVIGSKLIAGAQDDRPLWRHAASEVYSTLLRVTLGFRGTDTHGLKAFRKDSVGPLAARCVVDQDVFASELVIRAYRAGLEVVEIPVQLREKRPPSVNLVRRVPAVLRNLAKLAWAIGVRG